MKLSIIIISLLINSPDPQMLFKNGDDALINGDWQKASANFKAAIDTGVLNEAGMAVAYWNLHIAEYNMGHINKDMEAVLGFIVYGSDFIQSESPALINWGANFKLKLKLEFAISLIQARWAGKNNYSCRSEAFSCHIFSNKSIEIFGSHVPFCAGENIKEIKTINNKNILQTNVICSNKKETYYFTIQNE